jgi:mannose/cellobiose epimerase-like protein (N-acyl-D-glucosamine 2-epimerase family)
MNDAGGSARRVAGLALDAMSLAAIWCECVPRDDVGFAESVGAGWRDTGDGTKTMLCQSRLAYVFTHAGLLGNRECGALGAVSVERMNRLFWRSDARGWVRAIDALGRCTDLRIDSYDQAFGLLALAWHFRATAAPEFRAVALAALAGLDTAAADAGIEGYPEWRDIQGKAASTAINGTAFRRQNTHMHLLEAFLA